MNHLFPIAQDDNRDVRNFLLNKVMSDIKSFDDNRKIVAHRSMIYFPGVVRLLLPYFESSPDDTIRIYYDSITFAIEYSYLYEFKEIYPAAFQNFYVRNIQKIRKHIKELIFDDIGYYLDEDDGKIGFELDSLLMVGIEELCNKYGFKLTEKYVKELETTFEIDFTSLYKEKKTPKEANYTASEFKQKEKKYKPKPYASIIKEYLPVGEKKFQPIGFLEAYGYNELLKEFKKNNSVLDSLKHDKEVFESICHFIVENKVVINNTDTYHLIEKFFNYYCDRIKVHPESYIKAAFKVIEGMDHYTYYSTTKSKVLQAFKEVGVNKILIENLKPILIPYGKWYRFGNSVIETYVIAKFIDCFERDEFSKIVTESLWKPDDHRLLHFLQSANTTKFWEFYIIPQLNRLLDNINFTSQHTILLSFVNFFDIEFELVWEKKKKRFNFFSSSNSESHYENILQFCSIEFHISDFEVYFVKDYQDSDSITRLPIHTKVLRELYERVLKTTPKK